jgi:hypothetical protein
MSGPLKSAYPTIGPARRHAHPNSVAHLHLARPIGYIVLCHYAAFAHRCLPGSSRFFFKSTNPRVPQTSNAIPMAGNVRPKRARQITDRPNFGTVSRHTQLPAGGICPDFNIFNERNANQTVITKKTKGSPIKSDANRTSAPLNPRISSQWARPENSLSQGKNHFSEASTTATAIATRITQRRGFPFIIRAGRVSSMRDADWT